MAANLIMSILKGKCPRCRSGNLFENPNPYIFKDLFKMPEHCSKCGKLLMPQPRFFDGSMYINYAFSVAIVITVFTASNVLFEKPNVTYMILAAIGGAILFAPYSIRLTRTIWASIFWKYDPKAVEKFDTGKYEP